MRKMDQKGWDEKNVGGLSIITTQERSLAFSLVIKHCCFFNCSSQTEVISTHVQGQRATLATCLFNLLQEI